MFIPIFVSNKFDRIIHSSDNSQFKNFGWTNFCKSLKVDDCVCWPNSQIVMEKQ
jgi:hypothetical protein